MRREEYLLPLFAERPDRVGRYRLEILTTVLGGPTVDPIFRETVVKIPQRHPIYRWKCVVETCERTRTGGTDMCSVHSRQLTAAEANGIGKAAFVTAAQGLERRTVAEEVPCRICPERPATLTDLRLCLRHQRSWSFHCRSLGKDADFDEWVAEATPCPGYGPCVAVVCPNTADSPLGLCCWHDSSYRRQGRPGGAVLPEHWWHRFEQFDLPVTVEYGDEQAFRSWCAAAPAQPWAGQINLRGLRPLVRAEIQWGLFVHTQQARPSPWDLGWIRTLVTMCRTQDVNSLIDLEFRPGRSAGFTGAIAKQMLHELRLVYFTPAETKEAGFLETEHFGVLFPHRMSHFDLTGIPQRWLRDLAWDYLAELLRSPGCPRSAGPVDSLRRAAIELGVFLEIEAPGGAHNPAVLRREHMDRFVADQRHREREGLPSLAIKRQDGTASIVTDVTRSNVFNAARKLLRDALENGAPQQIGLDREFIIAIPNAGATVGRTPRRPFPDEVARVLADEANLARLEASDLHDCGVRDMWETTVITGRRIGEVIDVRWDCPGRYGGLAMFWHDQTKVGNYDAAIRIPDRLYERLAERQRKTLDRFTARYGYRPTAEQRGRLALFPTIYRSQDGTVALTHQWFYSRFRPWVDGLDLDSHVVPHQTRHTLATNLLKAGAS